MAAEEFAPADVLQKSQFLRPTTNGLIERSARLLGNRQPGGHGLHGMRLSTSAPFGASVKILDKYSKGTSPFSLAETVRL